jgi:hypothetical protein
MLLQLWRVRRVKKDALDYIVILLSVFQGHWIILILLVLTTGLTERVKDYFEWFEATAITETVLEAIPQLLLQSYIIMSRRSTEFDDFRIQLVAVIFSLSMACKTIVLKLFAAKASFKGPKQQLKPDHYLFHRWTQFWVIVFGVTSLASRSIIIVLSAYTLGVIFFPVFGLT